MLQNAPECASFDLIFYFFRKADLWSEKASKINAKINLVCF